MSQQQRQRKVAALGDVCVQCGSKDNVAFGQCEDCAVKNYDRDNAHGRGPASQSRDATRKTAEMPLGHVSCASCGHVGPPVLGDATASNCGSCGSYSISHSIPVGQHGEAAASDKPVRMASKQAGRSGNCSYCEGPSDNLKHVKNEGLLCPDCQPEPSIWDETGKRRAGDGHPDWRPFESSRKTATIVHTDAWRLNPGDAIKTPNGRTMKVQRVRQHETSANHVYIDTDGGTTVSQRGDKYQVIPHNSQQQSLPGYGTPGGNTNSLPGDVKGAGGANTSPSNQCPSCKGKGTLARSGDHYTCSKCGYKESFGGASGHAFSDSPRQVQVRSSYSTVNTSGMSAIAQRARAVLAQEEYS